MNNDLRLIQQLDQMPYGSAKAEAARGLWGKFQSHPEPTVRFKALCSILQASTFSGASDYFLSLFPQLVRLKREHPEAVDSHTYVWRLKWLVGKLYCFPEISLARISESEELYENALLESGGGKRTAIYMRWQNAFGTGRIAAANSLRESFTSLRRDSNSDCHACEINAMVREAAQQSDFSRAVETAAPILSGRTRCAEVPHATYGTMLLPQLLAGNTEAAARHHRKGYSLVRTNVGLLDVVGDHLTYLAATGDSARGLRLLKVHVSWLDQNFNPRDHLDFLTGMSATLENLVESGARKRPLKLALPSKWAASLGDGPVRLQVLVDHVIREMRELAKAFDRRNGNTWQSDRVSRTLEEVRTLRSSLPKPLD